MGARLKHYPNLGVRYDVQQLPSPISLDGQIHSAARFGIAWAPGKRNTVVRASYGLYYTACHSEQHRMPYSAMGASIAWRY